MSLFSEDPFLTTVETTSASCLPEIIEDTEITIQHEDDDDSDHHQDDFKSVGSLDESPKTNQAATNQANGPESQPEDVNNTTYDNEEEEEPYDEEDVLDHETHFTGSADQRTKKQMHDRFVVNFISACDIPAATDFRSKSDPFLRAYLVEHQAVIHRGRSIFKMKRVSPVVTTHRRNDCNSAVWNCFRDFQCRPADDAVLVVECFHAGDPEVLLGKVDIPMHALKDETIKTFFFIPTNKAKQQKYPKFSVSLQRAWIDERPPKIKTFFLIRHGESKWNKAQSSIDIPGMLDRDHPLTDLGIRQAEALNKKWKEYAKLTAFQFHLPTMPELPPVKSSPKQSPSKSSKNYTTADLLGLDEFDEPPAPAPAPAPASALTLALSSPPTPQKDEQPVAASQTPKSTATSDSCKSTVDFFSDNFVLRQLQHELGNVDDDDAFRSSQLDIDSGSDSDEDGDEDSSDDDEDASVGYSSHRVSNPDIAASSGNRAIGGAVNKKIEERLSGADDLQDGLARCVERESSMDRNAELLANQFHANNNNLSVAESAAAKERHEGYIRLFLHADRVFTSPLTRALQTALCSMEGHRAVTSHGFILYSIIREVRRLGGLDTMGVEVGEGIERRVRSELAAILGSVRADELLSCPLTINDTDCMWWTPLSSHDNEQDQTERILEFLTFSRYCDSKIPVFVGHSLFFRAFYSKRVSNRLLTNRKQLSEKLKRFRLSNASILAVTVVYKDLGNGMSDALMLDADLIFGGGFHAHSTPSRRDFMSQLGTSPTVFGNLGIPSGLATNIQTELRNKTEQLSNGVKKFSEKLLSHF